MTGPDIRSCPRCGEPTFDGEETFHPEVEVDRGGPRVVMIHDDCKPARRNAHV